MATGFGDDLSDLFRDPSELDDLRDSRPRSVPVAALEGGALSAALTLPLDELELRLAEDEDEGRLHLTGTLHNQLAGPVELRRIVALLRDEDGRLLDCPQADVSARFRRVQELLLELELAPEVAHHFATLELRAEYELAFSARLLSAATGKPEITKRHEHRDLWPLDLKAPPLPEGLPPFELEATVYLGQRYEPFCDLLLELRQPTEEVRRADVVVALLGEDGRPLARESIWLSRIGARTSVSKTQLSLDRAQLVRVRRLEVAVQGECIRVERIALLRRSGQQ